MKLFYFLVFFSNTFYCTTIEQIKTKHKKELKLSKLGKKVTEKHEAIESLYKKIRCMSSEETNGFSPEQSEEYHKSIMAFVNKFKESKNINGLLLSELLKKSKYEEHPSGFDFDAVKFYIIHLINEYTLLKKLIMKYEKLAQKRNEVKQLLSAASTTDSNVKE